MDPGKDTKLQQQMIDLLVLMLSKGVDVNAKTHTGNTALHFVRSYQVLNFLIDRGAQVNVVNGYEK